MFYVQIILLQLFTLYFMFYSLANVTMCQNQGRKSNDLNSITILEMENKENR